LLDIGPTHDGLIPIIQEERLMQIGSWLQINGDAIYSTSPWRVQNDSASQDVWFTAGKDGALYAIFWDWPSNNQLQLINPKPMGNAIVNMLGYSNPLKWTYQNVMTIFLPALSPANQNLIIQPVFTIQHE